MAKAKRRRLAAIEKQNKTILPSVTENAKCPELSSLFEIQDPCIEYRRQRIVVLIPPLPEKAQQSQVFQHTEETDLRVANSGKKQASVGNSTGKASGIMKLILKHGAWRKEKIISTPQLPQNNVTAEAQDQHFARKKSQEKQSEAPVQVAKGTQTPLCEKPFHANTDLGIEEVSITPAPELPKGNSEPQIASKVEDPVSCKEMDILDSSKANEFQKKLLLSEIAQLHPQEFQAKSTILRRMQNVNGPGEKEEEKLSLFENAVSKGRPATMEVNKVPDIVPLVGRAGTDHKTQQSTQLSLYPCRMNNVISTRLHQSFCTRNQSATFCLTKSRFPSFHGTLFDKKEDRVNRMHQKIEKAGGLESWLFKSGLGQFVKIFQERNVEIPQLLELNMGTLKQMGAAAVGPRRKLIHAIDSLTLLNIC